MEFPMEKGDGMKKLLMGSSMLAVLCASLPAANAEGPAAALEVRSIRLDAEGKDYLRLLGGPPETVTMRSGLVVLGPGKSVGRHNTKGYEEMVIVLEGRGEMRSFAGRPAVPLEAGMAAYCPPKTEHDVFNTGDTPLKYVYVVAAAGD